MFIEIWLTGMVHHIQYFYTIHIQRIPMFILIRRQNNITIFKYQIYLSENVIKKMHQVQMIQTSPIHHSITLSYFKSILFNYYSSITPSLFCHSLFCKMIQYQYTFLFVCSLIFASYRTLLMELPKCYDLQKYI